MTRALAITVGTSLRVAACWDPQKLAGLDAAVDVQVYEQWCSLPLKDRYRQQKHPAVVKTGEILRELTGRQQLLEAFTPCWDRPGIHCAEITTLLAMWRFLSSPVGGRLGFPQWIDQRYSSVEIVCGGSESDPGRIAGEMLKKILDKYVLAGERRAELVRLAGKLPHDVANGFRAWLEEQLRIAQKRDLVLSGGYKAYALLGGSACAARPDWTAYYVSHEEVGNERLYQFHTTGPGQKVPVIVTEPAPFVRRR